MPATPSDQNYYQTLGNYSKVALVGMTNARAQVMNPTEDWYDQCQKFVRTMYGITRTEPTAIADWHSCPTDLQHSWYTPPAGVPVFWSGGTSGDGHVALATGDGHVWSTDIQHRGKVSLVPIGTIHTTWGLKYLGWTEQCDGVTVYAKPPGN